MVIALILVNIVLSWNIEGQELASVRRYPNEGQYSPISVYLPFYYIAINRLARLDALQTKFCENSLSASNSKNSAKLILQERYHFCTTAISYVI